MTNICEIEQISVDMSTCDLDADKRLFAKPLEMQGNTLLCEVSEKNYEEDKLTFTLLKSIKGYDIYYCVPDTQRKIHCSRGNTAMFVMAGDEIVFIPQNYRSQFAAVKQCEDFIESQIS